MDEALEALRTASERLAEADVQRAALMRERDLAVRAAMKAGATWRKVQDVSGLTPRGVSQAIARLDQ